MFVYNWSVQHKNDKCQKSTIKVLNLGESDTNRFYEKHKLGLGRVTWLAESPGFEDRITVLAGTTFFHVNVLARLPVSTRTLIQYTKFARSIVFVEQWQENQKLAAI